MTQVMFYVFGAFAVVFATLCILQRNPMSAVLCLVATMFSLAAIYVLLYAGAVMVLFLFVIMLLNLGHAATDLRGPSAVATAIVIVGLLVIELAALWHYTPRRLASEISQAPAFADPAMVFAAGPLAQQEAATRGVVGAIAAPLFQVYLVPFEITSILLLAAIVGAVVLAKRKV